MRNDLKIEKAKEAQKRKIKRLYNSKVLCVDSEPNILKISEAIAELSRDHLKGAETDEELNSIISLACLAWNLSLLEEPKREAEISRVISKLKISDDLVGELREVLNHYFSKKMKHYAEVNRFILDYEIVNLDDDFHLNIISSISEKDWMENETLRRKFENYFNDFSEKE